MASREFKITHVACVCGMHSISIGQQWSNKAVPMSKPNQMYMNVREHRVDTCVKELKIHVSKINPVGYDFTYLVIMQIWLCRGSNSASETLITLFNKISLHMGLE